MSQYPEHDKLTALENRRDEIQNFIDWIYDEQKWWIAEYPMVPERVWDMHTDEYEETGEMIRSNRMWPINLNREKIMALYFDIDLDKLSAEKQQMLDELRAMQTGRTN